MMLCSVLLPAMPRIEPAETEALSSQQDSIQGAGLPLHGARPCATVNKQQSASCESLHTQASSARAHTAYARARFDVCPDHTYLGNHCCLNGCAGTEQWAQQPAFSLRIKMAEW
jgi:hypothetical protein